MHQPCLYFQPLVENVFSIGAGRCYLSCDCAKCVSIPVIKQYDPGPMGSWKLNGPPLSKGRKTDDPPLCSGQPYQYFLTSPAIQLIIKGHTILNRIQGPAVGTGNPYSYGQTPLLEDPLWLFFFFHVLLDIWFWACVQDAFSLGVCWPAKIADVSIL